MSCRQLNGHLHGNNMLLDGESKTSFDPIRFRTFCMASSPARFRISGFKPLQGLGGVLFEYGVPKAELDGWLRPQDLSVKR